MPATITVVMLPAVAPGPDGSDGFDDEQPESAIESAKTRTNLSSRIELSVPAFALSRFKWVLQIRHVAAGHDIESRLNEFTDAAVHGVTFGIRCALTTVLGNPYRGRRPAGVL